MTHDAAPQPPADGSNARLLRKLKAADQRADAIERRLAATEVLLQQVLLQVSSAIAPAETAAPAAASPAEPPPVAPSPSYVATRVLDATFGIPLERVREVIRRPALSELPDAPRAVAGLLDFRGTPVVVVDLRVAFGHPPRQDAINCWVVLIEEGAATYGLQVDQAYDVTTVDPATVRYPAELGQVPYVVGLAPAEDKGGYMTLLTPGRLLRAVRADAVAPLEDLGELPPEGGGETPPEDSEAGT